MTPKFCTVADAMKVVDTAAEAFKTWSRSGPSQRRELLHKTADLLIERTDAFVECMVRETATSVAWAQFNVKGAASLLRETAALTTQVGGETIPSDQPGSMAMTVRVPAGVVLGIAPWNAPIHLGFRALAMPLACGNTVVLKAAEFCPETQRMMVQLMLDAGFAPGVVNVVAHEAAVAPEMMEALIAHPAVRRVNFTGSTRIGRIVGALAGQHLKPALLELGGKASLVVLKDADIEAAVNAAAFGAFLNQGQICMSTERVVVEAPIADRFAEALAAKANRLAAGNSPLLNGCLISEKAAARVVALVDDAVAKGARLLTPMRRDGARISPLVLDGVRSGMDVYSDESFGPIAAIVRVADADEAVRIANDTSYGLAGAVFGSDISRTLQVAQRMECGLCHINAPTVRSEPQLPFGGIKDSGFGRFGGKYAISEFTDLRTITIQTTPSTLPF
jgi:acyl-CoA reductase-like NAD-dependent aldehyde dehydrogenase